MKWLSLHEASAILGAHPATVRGWADRGKMRTLRTPGGHRRFAEDDVRALAVARGGGQLTYERDVLVQNALGRTRLELVSGRLEAEPWYQRLHESAKEEHRALGRHLVSLVMAALDGQGTEVYLLQARRMGADYGALMRRQSLTVLDAVQGFLLFRDFIVESILQVGALHQPPIGDPSGPYHRVTALLNQVLLVLLESLLTSREVPQDRD